MHFNLYKAGAAEPKGQEGQLPPVFRKNCTFSLKLYENTANYNTLPPQILSFQYIALPDLRASAGPEEHYLPLFFTLVY